jgi:hypothetical protein
MKKEQFNLKNNNAKMCKLSCLAAYMGQERITPKVKWGSFKNTYFLYTVRKYAEWLRLPHLLPRSIRLPIFHNVHELTNF